MFRSPSRVALLLALLVAAPLAGCGKEDNPADPEPDPPGYTNAAEAVEAWGAALTAMDLAALEKMLEPDPAGRAEAGFRFYPPTQDVGNFPWMTGDAWSRADELGMLGNMMNPAFVSQENGNSVDSITAELEILLSEEAGEGTLVTAHAIFTVFWAENSGAFSDVRLEILLVRNTEGYFVLRSMRELPLLPAGRSEMAVPVPTWANTKAMYR